MKKVYIVLILLVLILTACGPVPTSTEEVATVQESTAIAEIVSATQTALAPVATETAGSSPALSTEFENAAPVSIQLMVGILQLEATDLAVTSSQAESLISVLTFLKDVSTNTSATQEQIDTLMGEAQSILTSEQIQSIAEMQITQEMARSLMQKQGNNMGNPPPQGEMPQGTPPAGGPPGTDQMGTPPADGMGPTLGFVPPQLIDTLIQLLESKTAAS